MNTVSRTITGALIGLLGALLLVSVITEDVAGGVVLVGIGVFLVGVGGYIFFNSTEDDIEEVHKQ